MLDVACGTGLVARLAAEAVGVDGRVAALDVNPGMLAVAAELPVVEGAAIEWIKGTAQALPFAAASLTPSAASSGCSSSPIERAPDARLSVSWRPPGAPS